MTPHHRTLLSWQALCVVAATALQAAQIPLRWEVETSRPARQHWPLLRGESVRLEPRILSYRQPVDLTGATVTLHARTNAMPAGVSFQVEGVPGRPGAASDAAQGWVHISLEPSTHLPAGIEHMTYTVDIATTNGRVLRAQGSLRLSGTDRGDLAEPVEAVANHDHDGIYDPAGAAADTLTQAQGYTDTAIEAIPTPTLADAAAAGPFAGHEGIELMSLTASNIVLRTVYTDAAYLIVTNTVTFSVTQTGEFQIDADLDMGGRSIINIGNESLEFGDGASISFTNSVFAVKRASPQAPKILFDLDGGRMINVRGFHYHTASMFPGPGIKWGFDVGGASLTNIANESLVFEDLSTISSSRITTTGGVDVTYSALHKVANIAYPVFDLPLGGEWTDFEIKASTNNFASNETMVYYYVSTTNQVWRPEIGDPEAAAWYTDDYSADPRVWRRKPEAGSIFAQLADPTNSVVPRVIFGPSLGVDEAFASWMYPHNPRLVWSFVRVGPLGFEQNASGTGQRWHPIRPASWEYQRPDP